MIIIFVLHIFLALQRVSSTTSVKTVGGSNRKASVSTFWLYMWSQHR